MLINSVVILTIIIHCTLPADSLYSSVSSQLVKRSQKMMEKYRQLLFDESMVSGDILTFTSLKEVFD